MSRLPNIQILRAVAALMVVVDHCGIETSRLAATLGQGPLFDEVPWGAGVQLFFAISGFIMVATTAESFGSGAAAVDFMRRRTIRIVPLYWLVTSGALAVALLAPSLSKAPPGDHLYIAASYLFIPYTRLGGDVRPLATPGWTLNLEMLFYVVFAVALLLPRRRGLTLVFGSLGLLVAAQVAGILPGTALNFWGDPIVLGFLFGVVTGIAYVNGLRVTMLLAAMLTVVGFIALFHAQIPGLREDNIWQRLAAVVPASAIVFAFALAPQIDERRRLWWPALLIGDASYSLYLLHEFLLRPLHIVWAKTVLHVVPLWTFIPVGIVMVVAASLALYWLYEKPVTRWLNALTRRRKPRRTLDAALPLHEAPVRVTP
jgi:exopolysaccharide production protein ExoZ